MTELHWGRGHAVKAISGSLTLEDMAMNEERYVYVDHSESATFAVAEIPRLRLDRDAMVTLMAAAVVDEQRCYTDGTGFVLRVVSLSQGDLRITWTRCGVTT